MTSLKGKIALVTGGSRNIGKLTALALAQKGADIVITYKERSDLAERAVQEIKSHGVQAHAIQIDFSNPTQAGLNSFKTRFLDAIGKWGRKDFDILINNAGTLRLATFDRVTEDDLDVIYNTNYKSVFFLTQTLMGEIANGGRIVNLGSGVARIAFAPQVSYGPLKAALQSLTLYLASFLGKRGITVNAVAPGGLDDDFNTTLFKQMPQAKDYIKGNTAVGRIGMPNDVAGVIAFLCTEEASFINGAIVPIDGGYHL